jgi:hypothetical protein
MVYLSARNRHPSLVDLTLMPDHQVEAPVDAIAYVPRSDVLFGWLIDATTMKCGGVVDTTGFTQNRNAGFKFFRCHHREWVHA